jgi:hypothetical protein
MKKDPKEQSLPGMENYEKPKVKNTKKTKTQMVVGHRYMYNPETGQEEKMTLIQKNVNADFNFHKIWLQDLLLVLNTVGDKKIKVLTYLLGIMNEKDNSMVFTQRLVNEITGVSLPTVNKTIKELIEVKAIIQDPNIKQRYYFNPDLIMKGDSNKRRKLLIEYNLCDELEDDKFLNQKLPQALDLISDKGGNNGEE